MKLRSVFFSTNASLKYLNIYVFDMLLQGRKPMIAVIVWLPNLNKPIFNLNDGTERVKITYVYILVFTKKICIHVVNLLKLITVT